MARRTASMTIGRRRLILSRSIIHLLVPCIHYPIGKGSPDNTGGDWLINVSGSELFEGDVKVREVRSRPHHSEDEIVVKFQSSSRITSPPRQSNLLARPALMSAG